MSDSGSGITDLVALNIMRGRDHGIPFYNQARICNQDLSISNYIKVLGLPPKNSFAEITDDVRIQQKLEHLYGNISQLELFIGALAESKLLLVQLLTYRTYFYFF